MLLFGVACQSGRQQMIQGLTLFASDSIHIRLEAINLSEDMSRFSTQNDEIMVLMYEYDSLGVLYPLWHKHFNFTPSHRIGEVSLASKKTLDKSTILFVLIEQDGDMPVHQLDSAFVYHYPQIREAFYSRNYQALENYLGDEDLLGINTITEWKRSGKTAFYIRGLYKMDKYEYLIQLGYAKSQ